VTGVPRRTGAASPSDVYVLIQPILDVTPEELQKCSPVGSDHRDFLRAVQTALKKSIEVAVRARYDKVRGVAGLVAPTGAGKTAFFTALSMALALRGHKVTILTAGKAARSNVMLRLLESVARLKERGIEPPRSQNGNLMPPQR